MSYKILDIAAFISAYAHDGQTRKDGVTPYSDHIIAVYNRLNLAGEAEDTLAVALLHDTLEDCPDITPDKLARLGIPENIIEAVQAITKQDGEDYDLYLERVKANPIAAKVKIADMLSNLADTPSEKQKAKYAKGLKALGYTQ
jgi:(p)ppGpp synthase/HD superfamily hydrolase